MQTEKHTARLAGLLWFASALTGGGAMQYLRSTIIVRGDAAATAQHIVAAEPLFRAAIIGTLLSQVILLFLGLTLYRLFEPFDPRTSAVLLASVAITVAVAVVIALSNVGALLVLTHPDFLFAFAPVQRNAIAMLLLRFDNGLGQGVVEIFWTPYFISFGLLAIRSRLLPKIIGFLLITMGTGFAVNVLEKFLFPQFHPAMFTQGAMMLGALGGIPAMLWLMIKGSAPPPPHLPTGLDHPAPS